MKERGQETLRVAESGDYNLRGILEIKAAVDRALRERGLDVKYDPNIGLYRGMNKKNHDKQSK
jgi:hypothetical protein